MPGIPGTKITKIGVKTLDVDQLLAGIGLGLMYGGDFDIEKIVSDCEVKAVFVEEEQSEMFGKPSFVDRSGERRPVPEGGWTSSSKAPKLEEDVDWHIKNFSGQGETLTVDIISGMMKHGKPINSLSLSNLIGHQRDSVTPRMTVLYDRGIVWRKKVRGGDMIYTLSPWAKKALERGALA